MNKKLTINQALEMLLEKYTIKILESLPDVLILKHNLIELKVQWGGNTFLENVNRVKNIITFGTSDPNLWK
jgi:hypothetical protein